MKKFQLSIPEPCHQNWDEMTPTQQGRFCKACAKQVIDFSEMSDTALLNYFNNLKNERVCGRAYPDQLNRTISEPPAKKLFWYWNYIFAFFLFFSKSNSAKAQGLVRIVNTPRLKPFKPQHTGSFLKEPGLNNGFILRGTIKDDSGNAIPFAMVRLLNSNHGVSADEEGKFSLPVVTLPCDVEISSVGYQHKQITVNDLSDKTIMVAGNNDLMKEVVIASTSCSLSGVIAGGMTIRRRISKSNTVKDTLRKWAVIFDPVVKIYPTPILRGKSFTVAVQIKQPGDYIIQILTEGGAVLLERNIYAAAKIHNEPFLSSGSWSNGIYFLRVIDNKGKNIGTGKFAIQ